MAPSPREGALGTRTCLLLLEFAAGRESAEFQQREAPRRAAECHPEGTDSPVWGRWREPAGRSWKAGREGRGTAQPLLSPILVLRPASRPPAHPTRP